MSLIEKCIVCKQKFNGVTNKSHYDLYHDAIIALKKGRPLSRGFVCKKCAHTAATVKCSVCGKNAHEFNWTNILRPDTFSKELMADELKYLSRARAQLDAIGASYSINENSVFVCDDCLIDMFDRARTNAIKKVGSPDGSKQTLWLKYGLVKDKKCCCRCGQDVRENFASVFRAYVDFFFLPFRKEKFFSTGSAIWDAAKAYLQYPDINEKWYRESVDEGYYLDADTSTRDGKEYKNWYSKFRQLMTPLLREKVLCKDCCAYLMSDQFRVDYFHARRPKWLGEIEGNSLQGYCRQIAFEKVTIKQETENMARRILCDKAEEMGANGIACFKRLNETYRTDSGGRRLKVYDFSGVPVLWINDGTINKICGSVIVDGSNVVFADNSKLTTGFATCLKALKQLKLRSFVFLDANIYHKLEDSENGSKHVKRMKSLVESAKGTIVLVPAGARADDFILKKADTDKCHILSNDRYKPYVERYPWIEKDRVHRFSFIDGRLMIPDFNIDIENK